MSEIQNKDVVIFFPNGEKLTIGPFSGKISVTGEDSFFVKHYNESGNHIVAVVPKGYLVIVTECESPKCEPATGETPVK